MKKVMPRYCPECGEPLVRTPSGLASCPNMHGKLQVGKPTLFDEVLAGAGVDCRSLPLASRKGCCWSVDGLQGEYRLRRPDDGDWKFLIKAKKCTLAQNGGRVLVLVDRNRAETKPAVDASAMAAKS